MFLVLAGAAVLFHYFLKKPGKEARQSCDDWEYGDEWKQQPSGHGDEGSVSYVDILRTDTGSGHDDSSLIDLVSYLGSRGIRATYDSFSLGLEPAAIKTYVLRVEEGAEERALEYLKEKFIAERSGIP